MRSAIWILLWGLVACDSNPTPHPQSDAGYDARVDTNGPAVTPDDDDVACQEAGGYWDGTTCKDEVNGLTDGAGEADVAAPSGDIGDADAADADDAGDGDAADAGPDASDAGPDAGD